MTTDKMTEKPSELLLEELKPCPFCGGEPCVKEWTVGSHDQIKIWCDSGECEVYPSVFGNKIAKIEAWNNRSTLPVERGVLEDVREALAQIKAALDSANNFISNGIELGFIRMPDEETPDQAHNTLPRIRSALAKIDLILEKKNGWGR